jgi:hypothetical protein
MFLQVRHNKSDDSTIAYFRKIVYFLVFFNIKGVKRI